MQCFCSKLLTQQFQHLTEPEIVLLKNWVAWEQTSVLAPTPPDEHAEVASGRKRSEPCSGSQAQKRLRTTPRSPSTSLIPYRARDTPSQDVLSVPDPVQSLVKTYPARTELKTIGVRAQTRSPTVKIFLTIVECDRKSEAVAFFRQVCCYAFAQLHKKNTSIEPMIKEIERVVQLDQHAIRTKIYNFLRFGNKWMDIIEDFAAIVQSDSLELRGLLCLLGSASTWERAKPEHRKSALEFLNDNTDIRSRAIQCTPGVNRAIQQLIWDHAYVESGSHSLLSTTAVRADRTSLQSGTVSMPKALHTLSRAQPPWAASLAAVSDTIPELAGFSEDSRVLLSLLSFLSTSDKIPLDIFRGAVPRKRWNMGGEIEMVDGVDIGLDSELCALLSDSRRLNNSLDELGLSSIVQRPEDETIVLDESLAGRIRRALHGEDLYCWRRHALIVAYRAIPWKYLEPTTKNTRLLLPHLKHMLQGFLFESLPANTRTDLALTLIEASRFPGMAWKRFVIDRAGAASHDLGDSYIDCRIAQARSLLSRIGGDMDEATSSIADFASGFGSAFGRRMHSAIGQATIQRSLNHIQVEELCAARESLENWSPLDQDSSSLEQTIVFRKEMLLGRFLRFGGAFHDSLIHLDRAHKIADQSTNLIFDDDLRELTCDHADTLRELDEPSSAESLLRKEITRRDQSPSSSGSNTPLELALAEVLFAQGSFEEAEKICSEIQIRSGLLKFERLRLHITMAKIRHMQSDHEGALSSWSGAMKEIRQFQLNNGRTSRIIIMSICDTLTALSQTSLLLASQKQLASLDAVVKPGGVEWWIAGMRHWLGYLRSQYSFHRPRTFL